MQSEMKKFQVSFLGDHFIHLSIYRPIVIWAYAMAKNNLCIYIYIYISYVYASAELYTPARMISILALLGPWASL